MDYLTSNIAGVGALTALGSTMIIIMLWSLIWKGLALWHSGRRGQVWWFLALLVINTAGILEIIYLFGILKLKFQELFSFKS